MKIFSFLFILFSTFILAQMPDVSNVWLNNNKSYRGTIRKAKTPLSVKIWTASQDKKNDQEYFVSGQSTVEKNVTDFEGKIKITKFKNGKKQGKVFGEYDFLEKPGGKHTGQFKGKFIYTFKWNKKTEQIDSRFVQFAGEWSSYDKTLNEITNWNNNE